MDLRVKVGRLFFVGFDGAADGPALRDDLDAVRPGGLVHFARNIECAAKHFPGPGATDLDSPIGLPPAAATPPRCGMAT